MSGSRLEHPERLSRSSRQWARGSIAGWMVGIGLVGFAMAPLANPSGSWRFLQKSVEITAILTATFLARFGPERRSGWYFGIATLGWANLVVTQDPSGSVFQPILTSLFGFDDLESRLAFWMLDHLGADPYPTARDQALRVSVYAVVRFWLFAILTLAGGWVGALLSRRGRAGPTTRGTNNA